MRTLTIISAFILLTGLCSCESHNRETGNEEAAQENPHVSGDSAQGLVIENDTMVTGVSGNTNAVNSKGNAGNGSGMGSGSNTEAQKKH